MFDLIFNLYLKYKKEHSDKMWKKIMKLPKHLIALFGLAIISAISSIAMLFVLGNTLWYWIPVSIELVSTIALGFTSEKYFIDNSQAETDEYITKRKELYVEVLSKFITSEDQLCEMIKRANDKVAITQGRIDKKYEALNKFNQVLFIPIILLWLNSLVDTTSDATVIAELSLITIVLSLIIYAIINAGITVINYDIVREKYKLQCFANDLQGILDVTVTFKLTESMQILLEEKQNSEGNNCDDENK